MELSAYPAENSKAAARSMLTQAGGPVVRALLVLRKFRSECRLVGVVGEDDEGRSVLGELTEAGIDTSGVSVSSGGTRSAHVWLSAESGSRTIAYSSDGPELDEESDPRRLDGSGALLLDGRHPEAALAMATAAKSRGISVAIDIGNFKSGLTGLVEEADIVVGPRRTWSRIASEYGQSSEADAMTNFAAKTCVLTDGAESVIASRGPNVISHQPPAVRVVDSNGAGDAFFGGFVWAVTHGRDLAQSLEFGAATASVKCARLGNHGLPSLDEVLALTSA